MRRGGGGGGWGVVACVGVEGRWGVHVPGVACLGVHVWGNACQGGYMLEGCKHLLSDCRHIMPATDALFCLIPFQTCHHFEPCAAQKQLAMSRTATCTDNNTPGEVLCCCCALQLSCEKHYLEERHLCSDVCWQPLQLPELPLRACIICKSKAQVTAQV